MSLPNPTAAVRVAATIRTVKWVLIALTMTVPTLFLMIAVVQYDGAAVGMAVGSVLAGLLWAAFTWVLFGWFEHTLGMLAHIATNTNSPTA